jgi:hypothetical protein
MIAVVISALLKQEEEILDMGTDKVMEHGDESHYNFTR